MVVQEAKPNDQEHNLGDVCAQEMQKESLDVREKPAAFADCDHNRVEVARQRNVMEISSWQQ